MHVNALDPDVSLFIRIPESPGLVSENRRVLAVVI